MISVSFINHFAASKEKYSANGAQSMGHLSSQRRTLGLVAGMAGSGISATTDRVYKNSEQLDETYAMSKPKQIKGRIETFKSHLKHCSHFKTYVKACASAKALPGAVSEISASSSPWFHDDGVLLHLNPKRQKRIDEYFMGISEEEERNQLNRNLLDFQANGNLLDSFIVLNTCACRLEFAQKMKARVRPLPPCKTFGGRGLYWIRTCENDDSSALRECQTKPPGYSSSLLGSQRGRC
jgi:hypothetical protein